jgi:hypothetical protein
MKATTFGIRWLWAGAVAVLTGCSALDGPTAVGPTDGSTGFEQLSEHDRLADSLVALQARFAAEASRQAQLELGLNLSQLPRIDLSTITKPLGAVTHLLLCSPQKYAANAAIIGPKGGSIRVGNHELRIPAGALSKEVLISAEAPVTNNAVVNLEPHGLKFAKPVSLELSYKNCLLPPLLDLYVVYLNPANKILEVNRSRVSLPSKSVTGELDHFSRYAIAW